MKMLVLGAGATGGYFGGRIAEAAHKGLGAIDVSFLVRPRRAESLRTQGLLVESPQGNFRIPARTVLQEEVSPEYDLVLLACKAYDLDSAIASISPALRPDTYVLPILNGLVHFDRLDREFGPERILGGFCHMAGTLTAEGVIRQMTDLQRITFGVRPGNNAAARTMLEALNTAYQTTPVEVRFSDDILIEIWEKFVMLASLAGITCLMRAAVGDIVAADGGKEQVLRILAECEAAARHAGKPPRADALKAMTALLTQEGSTFTASMLRDLESGGRTEAAHIIADMRARACAGGSDGTLLTAAWVHLQARENRLRREKPASPQVS